MSKNTTKRSLLASVLALVMCVTMLIGTTFAWFTDSASTSVSKIEAGKLDIDVFYANTADGSEGSVWTPLTDETPALSFLRKQADGTLAQDASILWEPNCTYSLPALKIVNNGNLALKYKVLITGLQGDSELNDVIEWTMKLGNDAFVMGSEHSLAAKTGDTVTSDILTIQGHMDADAGNKYQGMTIEGVSIKVLAVQDAVESDSYGNEYDKTADGAPQFDTWCDSVAATATVTPAADTVIKDREVAPTVTATVPAGSTTATTLTLIKNKMTAPAGITVAAGQQSVSADVKLVDQNGDKVTAAEGKFFTLSMQLEAYLTVEAFYHHDVALTKAASAAAVSEANDRYYYDAATGVVTFSTDDFSPFTAVIAFSGGNGTKDHPYLIATGEQAMAMEGIKGYFKLVDDVVITDEILLSGKKSVVIDLNGHFIKLSYADDVKPISGGVFNIGGKCSVTINDSSKEQTGAVIGSDKTYDNKVTCAIRMNSNGNLTINGGHFYGMSDGTSCIYTCGTYASVTINGGVFEVATPFNGIFYVLNHQDTGTQHSKMTVNGGSFKDYNPSVTKVDPDSKKWAGEIVLGNGCTTTSEVIDGVTWYTVSK